jgi:hypothetical protein
MSTLSALKPSPLIFVIPVVEIELVLATPEDLKEFHGYGNDGEKIMKLRVGMVYWLKSMFQNKIEPTPRIIQVDEDLMQLKEWLDCEMIYITRNVFL